MSDAKTRRTLTRDDILSLAEYGKIRRGCTSKSTKCCS
jgi:hypothetical protein